MLYRVYGIPTWAFSALISVIVGASAWLTIMALRPFVHPRLRSEHRVNDLVGFTFSSFAVFYGLLLGLLAVATYQTYANGDDGVTREAASLAVLHHSAVAWCMVAIGALTALGLISLSNVESRVHLILGGILSLCLGMVIVLIAAMDYPSHGEVSISPDAFQSVYTSLMRPQ